MSIIENDKLSIIQTLAENPDSAHIEKVAKQKDLIVLPLSEHEKLIKDSTSPDIDHIKLVAENKAYSLDKQCIQGFDRKS